MRENINEMEITQTNSFEDTTLTLASRLTSKRTYLKIDTMTFCEGNNLPNQQDSMDSCIVTFLESDERDETTKSLISGIKRTSTDDLIGSKMLKNFVALIVRNIMKNNGCYRKDDDLNQEKSIQDPLKESLAIFVQNTSLSELKLKNELNYNSDHLKNLFNYTLFAIDLSPNMSMLELSESFNDLLSGNIRIDLNYTDESFKQIVAKSSAEVDCITQKIAVNTNNLLDTAEENNKSYAQKLVKHATNAIRNAVLGNPFLGSVVVGGVTLSFTYLSVNYGLPLLEGAASKLSSGTLFSESVSAFTGGSPVENVSTSKAPSTPSVPSVPSSDISMKALFATFLRRFADWFDKYEK